MKRGYKLAGIVIVIIAVAAAALFLPSYFAKQGMDRLIASLPPGTQLTYAKTGYAPLTRTFMLKGAVLHIAQPALTIDAEEIDVKGGNPFLEKAIEKAEADPAAIAQATDIADSITIKNIHAAYQGIDFKTGSSELDGPKIYLGVLYAPLPPLKSDPSAFDNFPGAPALRGLLQSVARQNLAVAFDKEDVRDTTVAIDQADSGVHLALQIGQTEVDGYDRGSQQATTVNNFSVGGTVARGTAIEATVEKLAAGPSNYRDAMTKLRDGFPFEAVLTSFGGIDETIDKIAVKANGADIFSIGTISLDSSSKDGIYSVKTDVEKIVLNPPPSAQAGSLAILPQLGYAPAVFDFTSSYTQDPATGTLTFSDSKLVLESGGTITMAGSITGGPVFGITPSAAMQMKIVNFTLGYLDNSLATRLLDSIATRSGKSVDDIKAVYIRILQAYQAQYAADPSISAGIDALKRFVANPHQLILSVKPEHPIGRDDLVGVDPASVTRLLGLSLTAQ